MNTLQLNPVPPGFWLLGGRVLSAMVSSHKNPVSYILALQGLYFWVFGAAFRFFRISAFASWMLSAVVVNSEYPVVESWFSRISVSGFQVLCTTGTNYEHLVTE